MDTLTSNEEQAVIGGDASEQRALGEGEDDLLVANHREFFHEIEEVREALKLITSPDLENRRCREVCGRISSIWAQYQEQPGLLDPFLEELIEPLMGAISGAVRASPQQPSTQFSNLHLLSSLLYLLTTVRGYKTVARFFPHEAADLEPCLEAAEAEAAVAASRGETWATLYCLLLWLGMLLLTPFDLQSIDSGSSKSLADRVIELGCVGLRSTSRVRDASAWMLAKCFMRPDTATKETLQAFLQWTREAWAPSAGGAQPLSASLFVRCGALQAWNQALKVAPRATLRQVWQEVVELALRGPAGGEAKDFGSSSALRKLRVVVCYRAGLVALPPRLAPWRYDRGARSLLVNFAASTGGAAAAEAAGGAALQPAAAAQKEEEEDDEDAPEQVEEVIELLLTSLSDGDTVVRWAAAKGVGRLTNRLSRDFGDQVLESLLERCFNFRETDKAWHGGCLALAELTRRGLLLPDRLPAVVPLVCQALHFEQVSGKHAVGQHVRDAACYVCWAFARAYAPDILRPFVPELASALIQVAVYDREINCRRAAAAAVQEHVGRQGTFPDGIEVVTIADYWTLSSRRHAYLVVAPKLAFLSDGQYWKGLVDHLVDRKLRHQDIQIRLLASQALAHLAEVHTEERVAHLNAAVLPKLVARALDGGEESGKATTPAADSVQIRHGAVAAVAALTEALQARVSAENQTSVRNLVPALEKLRAYRGRGGEVVRQAACRLLQCAAAATSWPFKEATGARYLQTIDDCARHTTEAIQVAAVDALEVLSRLRLSREASAKALDSYVAGLRKADEMICARRGYLLCIGVLPAEVLGGERCSELVELLCREVQGLELPGGKEQDDPQARQYAVISLGRLCFNNRLGREDLGRAVSALDAAMQDYAVDRRGDVGSWVREAAMEVILGLLEAQRHGEAGGALELPGGAGTSTRLVALMLQQAVEKIDRLRERAFAFLHCLFCGPAITPQRCLHLAYRRICHGEVYDPLTAAGEVAGEGAEFSPPCRATWPVADADAVAAALRAAATTAGEASAAAAPARPPAPVAASEVATAPRDSCSATFDALTPLLGCDAYRPSLLLGLVVSVGGLTEHVARDAKKALLRLLHAEDGAGGLRAKVCRDLLQIFGIVGTKDSGREARRVLAPLLTTVGTLLAEGCFDEGCAPELLDRALPAISSSKDISRLRASIPVFVGLMRWPGERRRAALAVLLQFLGYSFPIVRQATAQALYIRLLEEEGDLDLGGASQVPAEAVASALELLTVTPWSTDQEEVLAGALREVYAKLGVELPESGRSLLAPKRQPPAAAQERPRGAEYADLVREAHF